MKIKKIFIGTAALLLTTTAFAYNDFGPYIGIEGPVALMSDGAGLKDMSRVISGLNLVGTTTSKDATSNQDNGYLTGRGYVGWIFNRFVAIEGAFSYYKPNKYDAHYIVTSANSSATIRMHASVSPLVYDLMAKFSLPLERFSPTLVHWGAFVKGGAAYVNNRINYSTTTTVTGTTSSVPSLTTNKTVKEIVPTYGAGIFYNFNPNFTVDIGWLGILGKNKTKLALQNGQYIVTNLDKMIPTVNMLTLGLTYKFTNLF